MEPKSKPRLIDAEALKKRLQKDPLYVLVERYGITGVIDAEPTVDAVPVRHGRWKFIRDEGDGNSLYECSECGRGDIQSPEVVVPYCWHCGARMDTKEKEKCD